MENCILGIEEAKMRHGLSGLKKRHRPGESDLSEYLVEAGSGRVSLAFESTMMNVKWFVSVIAAAGLVKRL